MSGQYCGSCGAPTPPGTRFCGNCGAALTADEPPTQVLPTQPPSTPSTPPPPAPPTPPTPPASPPPGSYPVGPPPVAASPGHGPRVEQNPFAGARPFGSDTSGGRSPFDAFLTGDWAGAAIAAAGCLGVMATGALVSGLLLEISGLGVRELISFVLIAVAAALGGDITVSAGGDLGDGLGGSSSLGLLPLTLTFAGLTTLGLLFRRRLRSTAITDNRDLWLQVLRTAAVLAPFTLLVALLSRFKNDGDAEDSLIFPGLTISAGIVSSVFGALLFAFAALAITVCLAFPHALPPRLQRLRPALFPGLAAGVLVFAVGLLAAFGGLVYLLATQDEKAAQVGTAVLLLPNAAISIVLLTMGVPLNANGNIGGSSTGAADTLTLLTFTDENAWFWLAPLLLVATVLTAATAVVLRQQTVLDGRREGFRFAGMLALVAFLATLLVNLAGEVFGFAFDESIGGEIELSFNPVVAAFVAALWGAAAGLLAPAVAGTLSAGTVASIRRSVGTAPGSPPAAPDPPYNPPYQPPPAG